jgi:hypothetical protein
MPTPQARLAMTEEELAELDVERLRYHSAGQLVTTPDVQRLSDVIYDAMLLNQAGPSGPRRSIVVDGPPGAGKSTLVKMIARNYERGLRTRHPRLFDTPPGGNEHIPVVYLSVPAGATPKMLTAAFATYLGAPMPTSRVRGLTIADLTGLVLDYLNGCGTALVIVDDAHFLDCSQKEGKLSNDHLKNLANFCPATFVLVGVNVEQGGLFAEGGSPGRATQTAGRFAVHRLDYQRIATPEQQKAWARTIWSFESNFALSAHPVGELASNEWRYLHQRTGGRMSTLSALLRHGAQAAILDGTEHVTKATLEPLITDVSTQRQYEQLRGQATRKVQTARAKRTPTTAT